MIERDEPDQPSEKPMEEGTLPLPPKDPERTLPLSPSEEGATAFLPPGRAGATQPSRLPKMIGGYRILGVLGVGGMGVVYEAEQESPHRRVALKVMRHAHLVTEVQAQQFRREVETLGRLKHPNIATIYASGQTEDGMAFYAMELVQGETLDAWLARRPARTTNQEIKLRLRMFRAACEAVHYAHLRGVIHRDLKPSNIMVLEEGPASTRSSAAAGPALKILDFGLARLVDPEGQSASMRTEAGVIMGTLQYMSPEQARGDTLATDFRTDVYALGMILFEMMAGKRPYELGKAALSEAVRVICEEPPARLDLSMGGSRAAHADLATIVGKSLEKEPDRRYPSAGALSEDVERYLTSEPIVARPPSRIYQTRMFVRRHRFGVSAAATLAVLLTAFGIAMAVQSRRIAREAEVSRRVSEFMTRMFQVSNPSEARGNTVTAREILDKASKEIGTSLSEDPEIQARLMHTMGLVYFGLGLNPKAEELLRQSFATQQRRFGPEHPKTLAVRADLGTVYDAEGRYKEAERLYLEALPLMRRAWGPEHPDTLRLMNDLCAVYADQGRFPEAEKVGLDTTRSMKKVLGMSHLETLNALTNLANVYHYQGRYKEAGQLVQEVLQAKRRILGPGHPATLASMNNLAVILTDEGQFPEAERQYLDVLELEKKILGPEHPDTLGSMNNLGIVYYREGRYAEAEALNLEILRLEQRALGPRNPDLGNTLYSLACLRARQGDREGALQRLRQAVDATLPPGIAQGMAGDSDLDGLLHGDPRFQALIKAAQKYLPPPEP